ncbi:MAG TPA: hypothetical protein DCY26_09625 [Hyphomonas sp.]|nr:hypothetical protein [Hyphomonas sp.]
MLQADHLRAALQAQAILPKDQASRSARISTFLLAYFPVLECRVKHAHRSRFARYGRRFFQ